MERDASDVAKTLRNIPSYSSDEIRLLKGGRATAKAMNRSIDQLLENASSDSTLFLFCSCHARYDPDGVLWLMPHKVPPQQDGLGVNVADLRHRILECPSNVMVILDCCYSGAIAKNNFGRISKKWRQGSGRIFLTSSGAHDPTYFSKECRNSPLTACLLRSFPEHYGSAQALARAIRTYFAEKPYWGERICVEERGRDFSLLSKTRLDDQVVLVQSKNSATKDGS